MPDAQFGAICDDRVRAREARASAKTRTAKYLASHLANGNVRREQSVAQLTEVAAFTVLFIYSNQSMTTLVTPLLSLSSIIRGSHRDL